MTALYMRQLELGPMKNFVYLLGDAGGDEVMVVDPAWEVDAIAQAIEDDRKRLVGAIVSHCHHDHINGLPELLARWDVPVYAHAEEASFSAELREAAGDALRPTQAGAVLPLGGVQLKLLHTPGHTPGSQCVLCEGALVSGDTVFVNACGRCDLRGGDPEAMYRSISQVLQRLPADTRLLPGHDYGDVKISSLGREQAHNPYFQCADLQAFIRCRMRPRG